LEQVYTSAGAQKRGLFERADHGFPRMLWRFCSPFLRALFQFSKRPAGEAAKFVRSGVELLGVVGAARLECARVWIARIMITWGIYRIEPGEPYFTDMRERWSAALRAAHIGTPTFSRITLLGTSKMK